MSSAKKQAKKLQQKSAKESLKLHKKFLKTMCPKCGHAAIKHVGDTHATAFGVSHGHRRADGGTCNDNVIKKSAEDGFDRLELCNCGLTPNEVLHNVKLGKKASVPKSVDDVLASALRPPQA